MTSFPFLPNQHSRIEGVLAADEAVQTMQDIKGAITVTHKPEKKCKKKNKVKAGDILTVNYSGSIDQSSEAGEIGYVFEDKIANFAFQIGTTAVIAGWDQGLVGMCVGETRTLVVPPSLGYGEHTTGDHVPGGSTLNYEIELTNIEAPQKPPKQNLYVVCAHSLSALPERFDDVRVRACARVYHPLLVANAGSHFDKVCFVFDLFLLFFFFGLTRLLFRLLLCCASNKGL